MLEFPMVENLKRGNVPPPIEMMIYNVSFNCTEVHLGIFVYINSSAYIVNNETLFSLHANLSRIMVFNLILQKENSFTLAIDCKHKWFMNTV